MPKHLLYGPVICGLVGAMCGVELALIFRYDRPSDRVDLDTTMSYAISGGLVGSLLLGALVQQLYLAYPRLRVWVELTATCLLLANMVAEIGWLRGDKWVANPPAEMVWGFGGGLALGACIGVAGLALDRRRCAKFKKLSHELDCFVDTGPDLGQYQKMDQQEKPR